jgi:uncharacterized membrane protein
MALFSFFKKNEFFYSEEKQKILDAIQWAEEKTSGEVRIYLESRCRFVDPLYRAAEIFWGLKMEQTKDHNAVLVYVALRDRQFAIYADSGIHEKVGTEFWEKEVEKMKIHFKQKQYSEAIVHVVKDIGEALHKHFPYQRDTDKNELPDDIVFGD